MMDLQERPVRPFRPGAVVGGVVLLALGAGLLLERSGMFALHHFVAPLVLIVLGALLTFEHGAFVTSVPVKDANGDVRFERRYRRGAGGGLWLIVLGAWLLVSQNHLWGFTFETSWPLFLIFWGVMMVLRGSR